MKLTRHILNAAIETVETRKSRLQSLGYQEVGCVANVNYDNNILFMPYEGNSLVIEFKLRDPFHMWSLSKKAYQHF